MNYQKKKKLNVPESLEKFLIEFTVEILINNPQDLNEFGYMYFKKIYNKTMEANFNRIKAETASVANSSNNSNYNVSNSDSNTHIKELEETGNLSLLCETIIVIITICLFIFIFFEKINIQLSHKQINSWIY